MVGAITWDCGRATGQECGVPQGPEALGLEPRVRLGESGFLLRVAAEQREGWAEQVRPEAWPREDVDVT